MMKLFTAAIAVSLGVVSVAEAATTKLSISTQGGELAFDKTTLSVKAGQKVSLTFKNAAPKDSGLKHDWVLVAPGAAEEVGAAAASVSAEKGYIPDSPKVLQHTKLIGPGEQDTISFTAPKEPGDYPYICTFPGHYATMKGVMKVGK
jgi:azurin